MNSLSNSDYIHIETAENPGAGYFMPGVWGCPPALKIPQDWGIRGLIEIISVVSYYKSMKGA
jgi:hypothetical protein